MKEPNEPWPGLVAPLLVCSIALAAAAGLAGAAERTTSRPPPDGWELEGDIENGELIYKQYCQKCHGKRGNGQGTMAKDLNP
ncbi:MAG: cytochrome c, partial [Thermoanaerobaculia bacterium]